MTTEKKLADALQYLEHLCIWANIGLESRGNAPDGKYVKHRRNIIEQALTAQAEAQPAENDVREAVEFWKDDIAETKRLGLFTEGCTHIETLIRAATAPKQTDAERKKALAELPKRSRVGEGFGIAVAYKTDVAVWFDKYEDVVKSALRAPAAVPQEVVSEIKKIAFMGMDCEPNDGSKSHVLSWMRGWRSARNYAADHAEKALALLQQKGGSDGV